uniref:Uncharacterized protein n=1 Tax=Ipomoea trifida TaxID=35884 RepID=A0PAC6_IPOTF|nr:hypothetical protein [Ipomoea trifida]
MSLYYKNFRHAIRDGTYFPLWIYSILHARGCDGSLQSPQSTQQICHEIQIKLLNVGNLGNVHSWPKGNRHLWESNPGSPGILPYKKSSLAT